MKYEKRENNKLEEVVETVDEKAQEIFDSYEDDYNDDEVVDNKKLKRTKLIINIVFGIIVLLIVMVAVDLICVSRFSKGPFFAIPTHTYDDGGTKEYYGIGYKVIKYHQLQGRRDTEIGKWSLKYNANPITVQDIDMAIEFNDDSAKAYDKYYKKFVRVITTLHKVDKKNRVLTIGYEDEGDKYTIDIVCDLNKDQDQKIINKFESNKEITVIGTVSEIEPRTNKTATKLHLSNCFAEQ